MSLHAGFSEIDITPPLGTPIAGWIKEILSTEILDPLQAHVAVFQTEQDAVAFVQLDVLSVGHSTSNAIRKSVFEKTGFPPDRIMVCATHTHAGPPISSLGMVHQENACIPQIAAKVTAAFEKAFVQKQPAEIGTGSCSEFRVAHNRRVVLRNGTVRTHGNFNQPDALFIEGPIDPEVAVLAVRSKDGQLLGTIVNYACHPTHHGSAGKMTAGYPGVLSREMKARGCPVTLFLNGAAGNLHTADPTSGGKDMPMEEVGLYLAEDVTKVIETMTFRDTVRVASKSEIVALPFRNLTEAEMSGTTRGAQRFIDPTLYDEAIPAFAEEIRRRGMQRTEIQVHCLEDCVFVGIPAELFCELGLRIKMGVHPRKAFVCAYSNDMVGYVPPQEAFGKGGYETTFFRSNFLAHEAGDMIAQAAIDIAKAV